MCIQYKYMHHVAYNVYMKVKVLVAQSCLTFREPHGLQLTRLLCPWNSSGKNIAMVSHFLLQGIFLIQGLNPGLLHCRQFLYQLNQKGSYQESLSIREMQIKTTVDTTSLVRKAIIKKSTNKKCWRECGEKETILYSWWECKLVQPLWKT